MVFHYNTRNNNSLLDSDDNASVSSTLTVDRENKELSFLNLAEHEEDSINNNNINKRSRKNVAFNLNANESHENNVLCKEDCAALWYQAIDYKNFKNTTMSAAKSIIQAESRNRAPFSYQRVMERTFQICRDTVAECETFEDLSSSSDRRHLQRWAQVAPSRVGMEKWAVRSIAKEKQTRRFEIVDLVLDLQETRMNDSTDKEEFIRKSCERISRPSRLFAMAVAGANAAVLESERSDDAFWSS